MHNLCYPHAHRIRFRSASIRNLAGAEIIAHPWSLSPNAAEPPASARSLHPLLFPPHGKCICCDAEGDLVVRLLGGKRSHAHGTYFTLLDGHGRAASSFYKASCSACKSEFHYSFYFDPKGVARFYDITLQRPYFLLANESASSASAFETRLLERYRLNLAHGQMTMTAFKEVFNELFDTKLDTNQLSDHCNLILALSFLQCMVPISSIDASPFIGRNHRRDYVEGLEVFILKIIPYVRTVFVRYWSQHFLRVDNPRMVSIRLFESHKNFQLNTQQSQLF